MWRNPPGGYLKNAQPRMHTVAVMYRKYVHVVIAGMFACGVFTATAPLSHSAPDDAGVETAAESALVSTVPFTDLGLPAAVPFYGESSAQRLTVPVPYGLTAASLNATAELPLNLQSGQLTVMQGDRTLSRVNVSPTDQTPIVLPLAGAEVVDDSVTVTVHSYLLPTDGACFRSESPLFLVNGTVSYSGIEQPATSVARFLPPVLRRLTVFLPQSPSAAESETAIQLASATTAHYGGQTPEITVIPLENGQAIPPTPPGPLERQVVIKDGPNNGLTLSGPAEAPWLLISGPLAQTGHSNVALLFSQLSRFAFAAKASTDSILPTTQFPGNTVTLRDLGQTSLNASSLEPQVAIGVDQTRFGRSIRGVRMHLQGSYTPLQPDAGGQLVVTVGNETIDHWPADGQGNIDRWVNVPDRLLQRYTAVTVTLNASGNTGRCGDLYTTGPGTRLLSLTINGDSIVQSSPAAPPVPNGFQSMPQALMPRVLIGIGNRSFVDTARAVAILVGLQKRTSATPIDVGVTTVDKALDSPNPAIVISADGWNHPNVVLPVAAAATGPMTFNAVDVGGKPATLTLDPALKFASLQTVFNNGRSVLVATSNGMPAQLDELIGWLNGDPYRWQNLRGVAMVSVPGQEPVAVDPAAPAQANPVEAADGRTGARSLWWIGGGVLAVLAVGIALMAVRRRQR